MKSNVLLISPVNRQEWKDLTSLLKKDGFNVLRLRSAKEAYEALRAERAKVIVTEYELPDAAGLEFLSSAKSMTANVEVVFLSEKASLAVAIEAMKAGAYDFYEIPVSSQLLVAVVEKAAEKNSLLLENTELERKVKEKYGLKKIIGRSKAIKNVMDVVSSITKKNVNVLLTGPTGTGKEMIANAIHFNSLRSSGPFIMANCAAYNEGIIESELFGHEKGAFTGAVTRREGRFELADKGTIFLDEVGDTPMSTQIKLLRVLQEKEFERVGGNSTINVDVRVIAATNRNLKDLVDEGKFREDLYYRLNVVHIDIPPLNERMDDIPLLVSHFIAKLNEEKGYGIKGISSDTINMLMNYRWPGNVRELENAIESAMALTENDVIECRFLPSFLLMQTPAESEFYQVPRSMTLGEMEMEIIKLALEKTEGNRTAAARQLGIGLRTLQRKLKDMALRFGDVA